MKHARWVFVGLAACTAGQHQQDFTEPLSAGERGKLLPARPTVRFVAVGDTGMGNPGQRQVAQAMAKTCAEYGCDFAILLGDNFYLDGVKSPEDPQWKTRFEEIYHVLDIPFYAVLGNHDYGEGLGYDARRGEAQVAYGSRPGKWNMPGRYYHFAVGNVEFFALDTTLPMYLAAEAQERTVTAWIGQSQALWKIALGHHPLLSNGPHGNAGAYEGLPFLPILRGGGVKAFLEEVVCGKVDLYLSGHDHSRQYLAETCKGTELVVSGAGAKTTTLKERNPHHFQSLELGFLYVHIKENTLTAAFINGEGTVDFTRVLTK
ncbi:MAG: metallophosphoesterase [Myxococcales bacterium]|nr:metallophosphoesterase [Polyangiaceae bacterium]MDW8249172.1 metallophosphoesterase [Myxococcales bacterium]